MPDNEKQTDEVINKETDETGGEKSNPDSFDDMDCRPDNKYPEADRDDVIPDEMKKALAEIAASKGGKDADDSATQGNEDEGK